jgi:hypothetical protein
LEYQFLTEDRSIDHLRQAQVRCTVQTQKQTCDIQPI